MARTAISARLAGGPLRAVGDVELAPLAWVHRHNRQRLGRASRCSNLGDGRTLGC